MHFFAESVFLKVSQAPPSFFCIFSLQMLTNVSPNTMEVVSMSASTSRGTTGARATTASAWHTMDTTV